MTVDYALMERAAAQRRWEKLHEDRPYHDGTHASWAKDPSPAHPYHRDDGTTVWVSLTDHGFGGDFLQQESGTPLADSDADEQHEDPGPDEAYGD